MSVRTATPVGSFGSIWLRFLAQAVPAISRCPTKPHQQTLQERAAVIGAGLSSADVLNVRDVRLICLEYSLSSGTAKTFASLFSSRYHFVD